MKSRNETKRSLPRIYPKEKMRFLVERYSSNTFSLCRYVNVKGDLVDISQTDSRGIEKIVEVGGFEITRMINDKRSNGGCYKTKSGYKIRRHGALYYLTDKEGKDVISGHQLKKVSENYVWARTGAMTEEVIIR